MYKNIVIYIIAALIVALPFALVVYFLFSCDKSFWSIYLDFTIISLLCEVVRHIIAKNKQK